MPSRIIFKKKEDANVSCILAVIQSSVREAHLEHRMATSTNHIDKEFVHGIIQCCVNFAFVVCPLFFVVPAIFEN